MRSGQQAGTRVILWLCLLWTPCSSCVGTSTCSVSAAPCVAPLADCCPFGRACEAGRVILRPELPTIHVRPPDNGGPTDDNRHSRRPEPGRRKEEKARRRTMGARISRAAQQKRGKQEERRRA